MLNSKDFKIIDQHDTLFQEYDSPPGDDSKMECKKGCRPPKCPIRKFSQQCTFSSVEIQIPAISRPRAIMAVAALASKTKNLVQLYLQAVHV